MLFRIQLTWSIDLQIDIGFEVFDDLWVEGCFFSICELQQINFQLLFSK